MENYTETVESIKNSETEAKLDKVSILLSFVCLAHCVSVPILFLIGGYVTSVAFLSEHIVHQTLLLIAVPLSLISLTGGYRIHKNKVVIALAFFGFLFLGFGAFLHELLAWEVAVTMLGSILLASAHLYNLHLRSKLLSLASG